MLLDDIFRYLRWQKAIRVIKNFPKKMVICDIGCGPSGEFLKTISSFINFGFGFDKNINFYKNSRIDLKKIDFDKKGIPLGEETVDVVTMLAVLEHLENPKNILRETFRILKTNGFLILTTPSSRAKPILDFLAKLRLINKEAISEHKKYYSLEELENLFLNTSFRKENINLKYFEFGFNILAIIKK
jgi:2-polyprenyl-3-methyl-5-hydroxy-6-metoxy-1,4-benzoquinol methylase